ncbi:MAG: putative peptidoglycan lipid flippase [Frankiales bacterium]|jgi:putative peptidoglycan lipid II flippase|nr:putative peptidoglycan lipid flippase [Frankiales bacterium]
MGLARAALVIALVTAIARVVGFARVVVFARTVGPANCLGNVYYTANSVPNIVFEIVAGGALASLVVPVLAGAAERRDVTELGRTTSALLTWTVLLLLPISIAGIWLAQPVMELLVGDNGQCNPQQVVDAGTRMLLVFLPQIVLYGVGIVLIGVLQAHRRFVGPALAPLLSSAVVIAAYSVFAIHFTGNPDRLSTVSRTDELILSVGTTLGVAVLSLCLLVPFLRLRVPLRPSLHFPTGIATRVRSLAVAGVVTLVAQQISVAIVLRLANDAGPRGAVTLYNLAWTVFLVPWAVLAVPIATSAFQRLSARADAGDARAFATTAAASTQAVLLTTLAAGAVLVAIAEPVARVLAQNGPAATPDDVDALARAIAAFAPGLVGYGLVAHVGRALYAQDRGRLAASVIAAGWIGVIGADLAIVASTGRPDTVPALALGNSVGMTLAGVLLLVSLARVAGRDAVAGIARALTAGLAGGAIGLILGRLVANTVSGPGLVTNVSVAIVATIATVAVFIGVIALAGGSQVRTMLQSVRRG